MNGEDAVVVGRETYIGDAVYASWDAAGQIRLHCVSPECEIFLEIGTYMSLVEFARTRWRKPPAPDSADARADRSSSNDWSNNV